MRSIIVAALLALLLGITAHGSEVNRVRKYLADRGVSNAVYMVDFSLRDDMDGKGIYIEKWGYSGIAKPPLAECPPDGESDEWAAMMDNYNLQMAKTPVLKVVENRFILMCESLAGTTNHIKLGFAELQVIIESIPDPNQMVVVTLQLLTLDAQAKREGGLNWWDTCEWHQEVVPYMLKPKGTPPAVPTRAQDR